MLCCFYVCVYIHFKSLGARNKTEEKLLEILQAKELPNFHETLSCLQEQLTAKAVKMASRLYLIPGENLMAFGLIRLNLILLEDYFELEVQNKPFADLCNIVEVTCAFCRFCSCFCL